jgi:hypothetical protein
MARIKDEVGNVYGRLRVLSFAFTKPARSLRAKAYWFCRCECGVELVVCGAKLRVGQRSCGCGGDENRRANGRKHRNRCLERRRAKPPDGVLG